MHTTRVFAYLTCWVLLASCVTHEPQAETSEIALGPPAQTPSSPIPPLLPSPSTTTEVETPSPNPSHAVRPVLLGITELRPGAYLGPHLVYAAFSADGTRLYLAYPTDTAQPDWTSMDIATGDEQPLSSPPMVYRGLPLDTYQYPSLVALVSPHNRYQLQLSQDDVPTALLLDLTGGASARRLTTDPNFGGIVQAQWSADDSLVAFGIYTPDFGEHIFVTYTATGQTHPLRELIGYEDNCPHEWQLSPDATKIALVDCGGQLRVFDLSGTEITHIPGYFQNIIWSAGSRHLYYYAGAEYGYPETLNAFDAIDPCETVLLTEDELAPLHNPGYWYRYWPFTPSPDQSQLLMWGRGLYLFRIRADIYDTSCAQ